MSNTGEAQMIVEKQEVGDEWRATKLSITLETRAEAETCREVFRVASHASIGDSECRKLADTLADYMTTEIFRQELVR